MFSTEEASVDGPCARADHRNRRAEHSQRNRKPRITCIGERDPQFEAGDNGSRDGGPHPGEQEYAAKGSNDLRNDRRRKRSAAEVDESYAN